MSTETIDREQVATIFYEAEHNLKSLEERHEQATRAAEEKCPRRADLFDLGMRVGMNREQARDAAYATMMWEQYAGKMPLYPREKREAWEQAKAEARLTAERAADDWVLYREQEADAERRNNVQELADRAAAYLPTYIAARGAFLASPANDQATLLTKLRVAYETLADEHIESALADAERLLGKPLPYGAA